MMSRLPGSRQYDPSLTFSISEQDACRAGEEAIRTVWGAQPETDAVAECSARSQLTCLPANLDPSTARQIAYVWAALSRACHYRAYELAPTAAELTGLFEAIDEILSHISPQVPSPRSPPKGDQLGVVQTTGCWTRGRRPARGGAR